MGKLEMCGKIVIQLSDFKDLQIPNSEANYFGVMLVKVLDVMKPGTPEGHKKLRMLSGLVANQV